MRVSVVIPVYNRSNLLKRALKSVIAQTYKDFDIFVVDDHSSEDIALVTAQFLKFGLAIYTLKSEFGGVSAARNTGIRASKSEWISFLDSDDEWLPDKLERQIAFADKHPDRAIIHSNETWVRNGDVVPQLKKHQKSGGDIFAKCTELCLIAPSSALIQKSLLERVGLFDESFPVCEDFDLWLRITKSEDVGFIEEPLLIKHGGHNDQLLCSTIPWDLWRVRALAKHLDDARLTKSHRTALIDSLVRKSEILLKGFEKHGRTEEALEVQGYLSRIRSAKLPSPE